MLLLKMPQKFFLKNYRKCNTIQEKTNVIEAGAFDVNLGDVTTFLKILIFIVWKTNLRLKSIFTFKKKHSKKLTHLEDHPGDTFCRNFKCYKSL